MEEVSVVLVVVLKLKAEGVVPAEPKDQDGVDGLSAAVVILGELQEQYLVYIKKGYGMEHVVRYLL